MYHIVLRVRLQILLSEMFQDSHFDESLMMESLLVSARTVKAAAINKKTPRYARKANASGKMPDVSDIIHCGYVASFFFRSQLAM